jgi:hypothetical protein
MDERRSPPCQLSQISLNHGCPSLVPAVCLAYCKSFGIYSAFNPSRHYLDLLSSNFAAAVSSIEFKAGNLLLPLQCFLLQGHSPASIFWLAASEYLASDIQKGNARTLRLFSSNLPFSFSCPIYRVPDLAFWSSCLTRKWIFTESLQKPNPFGFFQEALFCKTSEQINCRS